MKLFTTYPTSLKEGRLELRKKGSVSSIRSSTYHGKLGRALVMMVLDAKFDLDTHIGNAGAEVKA